MIDAALDHDGDTQPSNPKPAKPIEVLELELLAELGELAQARAGTGLCVSVDADALAELVRLYRSVRHLATSLDQIGRIGEALEQQIEVAERVAEGMLRRAGQNFEILLQWGTRQGLYTKVETGWHMRKDGLRWAGSFAEARDIVDSEYGPTRGTNAFVVVVRVAQ